MAPSLFVAALAGLLSFLSPCILPLVPAYLAVLTGNADLSRMRTVKRAAIFVAGFSAIFILLGLGATALGGFLRLYKRDLARLGGAIVFLLGLHQTGILKISSLYRVWRWRMPRGGSSWDALLIGIVFAFGWTPCVGPILAAILALAGSAGGLWQGGLLLLAYSLGLGAPFVAISLGYQELAGRLKVLNKAAPYFEVAAGILLMLLGVLMFLGKLAILQAVG